MAANSNFEVHAYPEQEEYDSLKLGSVGKKHPKRSGAGGTRGGGGGGGSRFGAGMPQEAPAEAPDNPYAQGAAEAHQAAMMQQAQQEHLMQAHNLHMQAQAQHFAGVGVGVGGGAEQQAALQMAHMAALELQQQQQMMMMMHGGGADMFDQQQGFAGAASSVKIGQPGFAPRPRFGKPTPSPQPQPWKKSTKVNEERSAAANEEGSVAPAVTTETQEESGVRATKPDETTTVAQDKVEEVAVRGTVVSNNNNNNNDDDDDNDGVQNKESVEVDGRGADPDQVDQGGDADPSSTPAPAATGGDVESGDGEKSGTPDPSDAAAEAATTSEAPAPPRERVRPTNTNSRQYYLYQQQQHREKRNDAVYNPSGEACCTPEEEERHAVMDERRKEFCKDMPPQARKNPALGAKKNKTPQGDFPLANMPMDSNPVFKNREFMNENPPAAPHPAKALVQASLEKAAAVLERQLDVDAQPWKPPGAIDPATSVPTDAAGASSTIVGGGDSTSLGGATAITSSSGVAIPAPPALGTVPASGLPDPLGVPAAAGAGGDGQPPVLQIGLSVKMLQNVDAQMREAQAQYHAAVQQVEMRHQALTLVLAKPRMEAQVFVKEREALLSNTSVDIGKVPRASDFLPVPVQELKQQEFPPQGRPSDDDLVHYTLKLIEKKTDIAMKLTELETSRDALTLALHLEKQRNEMMAQALKFLIQENQTLCAAVAGQHAEQSAATALLAQAHAQQAQSPVVPATGESSVTDGASANPFDTLRSEVTLKTTTAAADGSSPSGTATATDMSNDLQSMLMKIRAGGSSGEVPDSNNAVVGVDALASGGDESAGDEKVAAIMSAFGAALPTTTATMPDFDPSTFAGLGELMADSGREATPLADTPLLVDLTSAAVDENAMKTKDDKTMDERSVAAPAPSALPKPKSKQTFESVKQMKHPSPGTSPPPESSSSSAAVPTKMLQQGPLGRLPNPKSRAAKLQQEQDEAAAKAAAEAAAEAAAAQVGSARAANAGMNILSAAPPVSSAKVVVSEPVMKAHQKAVAAVTYIGSKVTLLQQQLATGDVLIDEAKAQIKVCEDELAPLEHELMLMQPSVDESMIEVQCAVLNSTRQAIAAASAAAGVPTELAAPTLGTVDPTSMLAAAGLPVALGAGPSAGNDGQELAEAAALAFIEDDEEVVVGDYNTVDVPTTASKPKATGVQALLQVTNETPRAAPDTTALLKAALKIPQQQEPNDLVAATSAAMAREAALQAQVRSQAHTAAPLLGNAPTSDDIWGTVAAATADDITGTVNMMFSGGLATYNEDDSDDNGDQEVDDADGNAAAEENVVAAGTTTSADSALANGGNALAGDAAGSSVLSGDAEGSVTSGSNAKEGKKQRKRAQVQEYRALGTVDAPFEELAKNLDFMTVFAHDFTKPTVQDVTLFDIQNPEHFAKRPEMRVGATFHRNLFTTKIPVPAPWTKHEKSDRRNASAKKHCDCFYFHNYLREKVESECVRIFVGHIPTSDNITPDAVALGLFRMFASHCGTPNAVVHVVVFTKLDPIERTACVWILPDYYQWVLELDDVLYTSGEMPFSIVVEPTEPRKEKDDRDRDNQRSINQKAGSRGRNSGAPRGAPFGKFGAALATSDYERTHPKNAGAGGMPMPFNQHQMMLQQMAAMQHTDYGNPSAEAATMWQAEMMAAGAGFQGSQDSYGDSSFNKGQYRAGAGRGGAGRGGGRGGRGGGRGRAGFSAENETAARMMSGFGMDY